MYEFEPAMIKKKKSEAHKKQKKPTNDCRKVTSWEENHLVEQGDFTCYFRGSV